MTMLPLPWNDIEAWLEASDAAEIAADIRAYAEQAVAEERERLATHLAQLHTRAAGQHNYFLYLAVMLREGTLYEQETNPT
jgi:hypothetical protein